MVPNCKPQFLKNDDFDTLFYRNLLYWGCENDCGKNTLAQEGFKTHSNQPKHLRGSFILSINDVSEIRELFSSAQIEAVDTTYSIGKARGKKVGERVTFVDCLSWVPYRLTNGRNEKE